MNKTIIGAAMSAALFAALPAFAQTAATGGKVAIPNGVFYKGLDAQQFAAKDRLIGANVLNKDGVVIGDIKDLILNASNEVEGVLLGTGGILGAGEKEVGVRYRSLNFTKRDGKTIISLPEGTKDVIAALEPFNRGPKKSLAEKAADKLQALKDKTAVGAGPAYEKAKAAAGPAFEKAKEIGGAAVEKAKELGGAAMEKGKEVMDGAKDKAATAPTPAPPAAGTPKQ